VLQGAVGSEVVKQLSVIGGANIKAAVHSTSSIDKIKSQGIDTIKIDYNNSKHSMRVSKELINCFYSHLFNPIW